MASISVYITSFNQKEWLQDAIESVLAQTLLPNQVIVIDDASTDGSQDLISSYHDNYPNLIQPIFHQTNTGISQVRIDALNEVNEEFVTYLDGDDIYMPRKLEKEFKTITSNPGIDLVFSNHAYIEPDRSNVLWIWADHEKPPVGDVFYYTFTRNFPRKNLFRMEMVNYGKFKQIGFHDPLLTTFEDFDIKIRLTKHLKVAFVDEVLTHYRYHRSGLAQKHDEHLNNLEYIYNKNINLLDDFSENDQKQISRIYWEYCLNVAKIHRRKTSFTKSPIKYLKAMNKILKIKAKLIEMAIT